MSTESLPLALSSERTKRQLGIKLCGSIVLLVGLVAVPLVGIEGFQLSILTEVLIFSIATMGLNLLVGYTGLVSFGHAAFFGVAAYTAGLTAKFISSEIVVILFLALVATAIVAWVIGWLSLRMTGFYFIMVTLAFAQIIYAAVDRWRWLTGGADGLLVSSPKFFGQAFLATKPMLYYVVLGTFVFSYLALYLIVKSPFGQALVGIRENSNRMSAIGYNVRRYKLSAFLLAGLFGGLAGILNVQFNRFVSPVDAHWLLSAILVIMVLIGGAGTLNGPLLGTAVYLYLQNWLSSYTEYWAFVVGVLFIALITGGQKGLLGLLIDSGNKISQRLREGRT
jgi:branched-chain amino acid transport system permease protein